ncbi:MAG: DUF2752 domain-containing protein [Candidatus Pacebacteria bacterium]|nr:DUF2752 domain-containing protein [Candidatus Paceibacterota bacterium]
MPGDTVKGTSPFSFLPKVLALSSLAFYLGWNAYWLGNARVPPSIMLGVFGVPAPTTGMTRSWVALLKGKTLLSLLWNPFSVPVAGLFACSLSVLVRNILLRQNHSLHPRIAIAWIVLLGASWIVKLVLGAAWW